jgi:hypothetical protein
MINKPTTAPPRKPPPPLLAALPHSPLSLQPPRSIVLWSVLSIAFSDSLPNQKLPLNESDELSFSEI